MACVPPDFHTCIYHYLPDSCPSSDSLNKIIEDEFLILSFCDGKNFSCPFYVDSSKLIDLVLSEKSINENPYILNELLGYASLENLRDMTNFFKFRVEIEIDKLPYLEIEG